MTKYVVVEKSTGKEIEEFQFMSVAEAHIWVSEDPEKYEVVIKEITEPYPDND